jgi:hypothetical protein
MNRVITHDSRIGSSLGEWSATLTLSDYGRVARNPSRTDATRRSLPTSELTWRWRRFRRIGDTT